VKFALDTNVFVDAFRDETFGEALAAFLERALPTTFLSAVVVQELAAGARTREQVRELESSIFRPFERRRRVFAPSTLAFRESGRLLAELAAREGWAAIHSNPSLANDALLAASCREHGFTLVTSDGDFDRFLPSLGRWRHVKPWPRVGRAPASGTPSSRRPSVRQPEGDR
jgi:predicted nucleic acid-binding protein